MISYITKELAGVSYDKDKLKNILTIKDVLIEVKRQGGKAIIIVDEGQLLCGKDDILQELRILINLNHENEYLHTFILSGQRPLWDEIKGIPELFQRLPVRYYFMPLRLEETKELIRFRLNKAGLDEEGRIFTDEALELIHRHSKGSPRTILALADMALLGGYADRATVIGFKEIHKALNMMSGRGESLPYITERDREKRPISSETRTTFHDKKKTQETYEKISKRSNVKVRPFFIVLAFIFFMLLGGTGVQYFMSLTKEKKIHQESERINTIQKQKDLQFYDKEMVKTVNSNQEVNIQGSGKPEKSTGQEKEFIIIKSAGNIRSAPDVTAPKIGMIFQGETVKVKAEEKDASGNRWFKVNLYGDREGWISESVGILR